MSLFKNRQVKIDYDGICFIAVYENDRQIRKFNATSDRDLNLIMV